MEFLIFGIFCLIAIFYFESKFDSSVITVKTNLNSYYSQEKTSLVTNLFYLEWIKEFPEDAIKFKKALSKVLIKWEDKRLLVDNQTVLAVMENPTLIRIWIGPRFKHGERKILFTGIFDQLALLALVSNSKEPNTQQPKVRKIINTVGQLYKQLEVNGKVELQNQD